MVHHSSVARRSIVVLLLSATFAAAGAGAAHADGQLPDKDPIFGDGCRYVAVDTPTDVDPHATVCRPV